MKLPRLLPVAVFTCALLNIVTSSYAVPLSTTDLSGTWGFTPLGGNATTIQVPGGGWYKQGFTEITEADYQRVITVPNVSASQVTMLEFGAVNYQADVYINNVLVGSRVTAFTPSEFDLSKAVTPGGGIL